MNRRQFEIAAFALLTLCLQVSAQDEEAKTKKRQVANNNPTVKKLQESLAELELTDEQKTNIESVMKKHLPKIAEVGRARKELLGTETNKKMNAARKEAIKEGKKGKELQQAIWKAAGLEQETIDKLTELNQQNQQNIKSLRGEIGKILTEEQRAKIGLTKKRKGNAKKNKKSK